MIVVYVWLMETRRAFFVSVFLFCRSFMCAVGLLQNTANDVDIHCGRITTKHKMLSLQWWNISSSMGIVSTRLDSRPLLVDKEKERCGGVWCIAKPLNQCSDWDAPRLLIYGHSLVVHKLCHCRCSSTEHTDNVYSTIFAQQRKLLRANRDSLRIATNLFV